MTWQISLHVARKAEAQVGGSLSIHQFKFLVFVILFLFFCMCTDAFVLPDQCPTAVASPPEVSCDLLELLSGHVLQSCTWAGKKVFKNVYAWVYYYIFCRTSRILMFGAFYGTSMSLIAPFMTRGEFDTDLDCLCWLLCHATYLQWTELICRGRLQNAVAEKLSSFFKDSCMVHTL